MEHDADDNTTFIFFSNKHPKFTPARPLPPSPKRQTLSHQIDPIAILGWDDPSSSLSCSLSLYCPPPNIPSPLLYSHVLFHSHFLLSISLSLFLGLLPYPFSHPLSSSSYGPFFLALSLSSSVFSSLVLLFYLLSHPLPTAPFSHPRPMAPSLLPSPSHPLSFHLIIRPSLPLFLLLPQLSHFRRNKAPVHFVVCYIGQGGNED